MKKRQILSVAFMFFVLNITAQTITIIDKTTRETIPGVVVFSNQPKLSLQANNNGQADISSFKSADTIFFKIVGYSTIASNYKEIESKKFKIELSETAISLGVITVSSNRWEEDKIETPNRIEKITKKHEKLEQ